MGSVIYLLYMRKIILMTPVLHVNISLSFSMSFFITFHILILSRTTRHASSKVLGVILVSVYQLR